MFVFLLVVNECDRCCVCYWCLKGGCKVNKCDCCHIWFLVSGGMDSSSSLSTGVAVVHLVSLCNPSTAVFHHGVTVPSSGPGHLWPESSSAPGGGQECLEKISLTIRVGLRGAGAPASVDGDEFANSTPRRCLVHELVRAVALVEV